MQGRSNARSARSESDPYLVLSLKLRRSVNFAVARHAKIEAREPSVFIRMLLEREVVQPARPLSAGWATDEYVAVPVRVRTSTLKRLRQRAAEVKLLPSQLAREFVEDYVLRAARTGPTTPARRAG